MNQDEVIVRLGLDTTPIGRGLRSADKMVKDWSHGVKEGISEAFKGLVAPLTGVGMVAGLEKIAEAVKRIKNEAEAAGVSTGFLQDIENVGKAAGVSAESVDSMLNKFVKGLPAGANVEESFFKMADRLASIKDPAERARVAIDAFGKSGMDMVKIVGQGSEAVKALAAQFDKLSDVDIEAIENAHSQMEKLENRLTIWAGKLIGTIALFAQVAGRMSAGEGFGAAAFNIGDEQASTEIAKAKTKAEYDWATALLAGRQALADYNKHLDDLKLKSGTAEEKMSVLTKRLLEQQDATKGYVEGSPDYYANLTKVADLQEQIAKLMEDTRKAEKQERQAEERSASQRLRIEEQISFEKQKQAAARVSAYQPTVAELANSNGPHGRTAREIQQRTALARQMFMSGNIAGANEQVNAIEGYDVPGRKLSPYEQQIENARQAWAKKTGYDIGGDDGKPHHVAGLLEGLEKNGVIKPEKTLQNMEEHLRLLNEKLEAAQNGQKPLSIDPKMGN